MIAISAHAPPLFPIAAIALIAFKSFSGILAAVFFIKLIILFKPLMLGMRRAAKLYLQLKLDQVRQKSSLNFKNL